MSRWKLKKSIFCQLLPSNAKKFQDLETRAHRHSETPSRNENIRNKSSFGSFWLIKASSSIKARFLCEVTKVKKMVFYDMGNLWTELLVSIAVKQITCLTCPWFCECFIWRLLIFLFRFFFLVLAVCERLSGDSVLMDLRGNWVIFGMPNLSF